MANDIGNIICKLFGICDASFINPAHSLSVDKAHRAI